MIKETSEGARQMATSGLVGKMNLDSSYEALAVALDSRVKIIADRDWYARDAAGHLAALGEISAKIETLGKALPQPVPGEFAHFLEKRSFEKALAWIRQHLPLSIAGE